MNKLPTLVLPKGRLYDGVYNLFKEKGLELPKSDSRVYFYPKWFDDCNVFIGKPRAIPSLMYSKMCEFGFCGNDIINDSKYVNDIIPLLSTNLNKIRICLCSRYNFEELKSFNRPIIIATEFEQVASEYFTKLGLPHYILYTSGSTEGYLDINADVIIDVVDSGRTLKENNINVIDVLFESSTTLFSHKDLCDCMLPSCLEIFFK